MKTDNRDNKPLRQEKVEIKDKTHVRRARREAPQEKDKFKENKERLQNELQEYMYSQSSKFSSVSRNLIFGILGTIWIMTYSEGRMSIPNPYLFYALLFSLLFLSVDVFHYFLDSISYHSQQYKLEKFKSQKEIEEAHEPQMDKINKRSHRFLIGKSIVLLIAGLLFLRGIWESIPSICELLCK